MAEGEKIEDGGEHPICEAFLKICDLAGALGVEDANLLSGCWEHQIDDLWWVAVNAHTAPIKCSIDTEVPPYGAYIIYNGWPAGIVNPYGGVIAAGAAANEQTFIGALDQAISLAARKAGKP